MRRHGRRSRVVLTSRRWRQPGDNAYALRRGWWQESPITREITKQPLKPPRRESRIVWRTCGDELMCFLFSHMRLRVSQIARLSLRPHLLGRAMAATRANSAARALAAAQLFDK